MLSFKRLYLFCISTTAQLRAPAACLGSVTTGISKCGIPLYTPSSTIFGSTIIILTSSGFDLYKILVISELIHTDLPEPVAPAIKICGKFAISAITQFPLISLPKATVVFDFFLLNSVVSSTSRIGTGEGFEFGISIPIADFPGIGASILTPGAARLKAISSDSPVIFETLTPNPGCSSNLVTDGPWVIFIIFASTLKLLKVSSRRFAFSSSSYFISAFVFLFGFGSAKRLYGGSL